MKSVPLEMALRACAEIGYSDVEFALNPGYPTEPSSFGPLARQQTRSLLKELNLQLPSLMVLMHLVADDQAHQRSLDLIASAAEMAHGLVPENPPILETILGGTSGKWEAQKVAMVERLGDWANAANRHQIRIALKAHVSSAVNSPDRLLWLLEQVPSDNLAVVYDYSHFQLQGIGLEDSLRSLLPKTKFIHVKDSVGELGKFQFVLPGFGQTDYGAYFDLLRILGYSGPVCVEVSGQVFNKAGYDPIAAAKECHIRLSRGLEKAFQKS
jgi:inosose dehydratase